jgi:hypothetical protein
MSGFVNGFLIYIIKVNYRDLESYFQTMLDKQLPNGDETNKYLRTAYFMFSVIKDTPSLEIEFLRNNFHEYESFFQKDFFTYLQENQT